jgi:hypothetical protein
MKDKNENFTAKKLPRFRRNILKEEQKSALFSFIQELTYRLTKQQASVMVGAGFSKNAESSGAKSELPSWIDLGGPFYKKLNGKFPLKRIIDVGEIQELAGEIESKYERTVLEEIYRKRDTRQKI